MHKQPLTHVLGFAFDPALMQILLLRKNRPTWAAGKVNGLGGKIEGDETPEAAMSREFEEECGLRVPEANWVFLGQLQGPGWTVACYAVMVDNLADARTMEDEEVFPLPVSEFLQRAQTEPLAYADLDSAWLVSFAQRKLRQPSRAASFVVTYPNFP